MFYYLGVDLGGGEKTFAVAIREKTNVGLHIEKSLSLKNNSPKPSSMVEIIEFVRKNPVLGTAIDAPLSFSINLEKGFRASDLALRSLLPREYRKWVLSYHALMGIPLRGLLLAQKLSPYCGAILETHPRASFFFLLPKEKRYLAYKYKKELLEEEEIDYLKNYFKKLFSLKLTHLIFYDDLLDALICALTSYLFFKKPEKLLFLPQEEKDLFGFGPFVIIGESFL
ncbi:MAG: DUF429 domain-containing protein [Caldimicrobium thiodismutans]